MKLLKNTEDWNIALTTKLVSIYINEKLFFIILNFESISKYILRIEWIFDIYELLLFFCLKFNWSIDNLKKYII